MYFSYKSYTKPVADDLIKTPIKQIFQSMLYVRTKCNFTVQICDLTTKWQVFREFIIPKSKHIYFRNEIYYI